MEIAVGMKGEVGTTVEREDTALEVGSGSLLVYATPCMVALMEGAACEAIAEALYGEATISGKTPFQIPATMDQVMLQREDLAKDIVDPLYDYGYGIEVASFGK